jgi:hypothetical protein
VGYIQFVRYSLLGGKVVQNGKPLQPRPSTSATISVIPPDDRPQAKPKPVQTDTKQEKNLPEISRLQGSDITLAPHFSRGFLH